MLYSIKNLIINENGGEGSQTAILIAIASVVVLGLITYAGTKIKPAVEQGGTTIDHAKDWSYGNSALNK